MKDGKHSPDHSLKMEVNPRGLKPQVLWQMDITHIPEFGKLAYVHVIVDTYSHVVMATARTEEAVKDVIQHLIICFSSSGVPKRIKTDNGPGYTGKNFQEFCCQLQIKHTTGIPYNPQGQGIVECAHLTITNTQHKLKREVHKTVPQESPPSCLVCPEFSEFGCPWQVHR